jgi:hypothetical protein
MNASRSVKKGLLPLRKPNLDSPFELASTDVIRCEMSSSEGSVLYAVGSEWCLEIHAVYAQSYAKLNRERTVAHESQTQIGV